MFTRMHEKLRDREEGFTLIELLVVVIIIGILAAIAIPTFLRQRERGWEAAAQSELRNAAIAQESFFTEGNAYAATVAELAVEGFNNSADFTAANDGEFLILSITGGNPVGPEYCMSAQHGAGGAQFFLDSSTGEPTTTACT